MANFDVIIRGGFVVDGTGSPGRDGDVAIDEGRIVAIDDLTGSAPVIETKGTPWWAAAVVAVVLLALFIVFVV